MRKEILTQYMSYVNEHGKQPASVFKFCKEFEINESEFYDEFADFSGIESAVLSDVWNESISTLQVQSFYSECSDSDKLLSVMYAYFESLKQHRSFLLLRFKDWKNPKDKMDSFKELKKQVFLYLNTLKFIETANTGVGMVDKTLEKGSNSALFSNLLFVFHYWLNDKSKGFEKTDALIEKLFSLSFELLGSKSLNKAFDLGKFLLADLK
jgi:hypothetical protein